MAFNMVTKYAHSPKDIDHYNTDELRDQFLMEKIFSPGDILLTYTYNDRMIFGGITPTDSPLEIMLDKQLGVDFFLQRREMGFINIGGKGKVTINGRTEDIEPHDGYYISMGTKSVVFESTEASNPAKFYVVSTPAHRAYPSKN